MGVAVVRLHMRVWQFCLLSGLIVIGSAQPIDNRELQLRLVNGPTTSEGRLEVSYINIWTSWGTICDRNFQIAEASVACRQLGFMYAERVIPSYSEGGSMILRDVKCNGDEDTLADCYYDLGVEYSDLTCSSNVGVACSMVPTTEAPPDISPGKLRLVGGADPYEGRVEVYLDEVRGWATLCGDQWDFKKAELACEKLGYRPATSTGTLRYGAGTGPIANCSSMDNQLKTLDCEIINESDPTNTCNHDMDVDLVCNARVPGRQGQVRLVNGSTETEGHVEFYHQNAWRTLCSDDWGIEEVRATCRQLGMPEPSASTVPPGGSFGVSVANEILLESITCTGQERSLQSCTWMPRPTVCITGGASAQCGVRQDTAQEFDLRLADGSTSTEGRVEMFYKGDWGTICNKNFRIVEATVICNQIGYQFAERQILFGHPLSMQKSIVLYSVNCNGNEKSILDCYHLISDQYCSARSTVGVVCSNLLTTREQPDPVHGDLRLVDGPNPYEGQVMVYISEAFGWASVCQSNWAFYDAVYICEKLEYRPATSIGKMRYGLGTGPIAICPVSVSNTEGCRVMNEGDSTDTCNHNTVLDIVCDGIDSGYSGEIRLRNSTERTEGRIEMFNHNVWKRVCSDAWGMAQANVACYQLGMPVPTTTFPGGMFGRDDDKTFMQQSFNCTGQEGYLDQCMLISRETPCITGDAGIQCGVWKDAKDGDFRLSGGGSATKGQVEVFYAGEWGTVCHTNDYTIRKTNAHVACHQFGFLTYMDDYVIHISYKHVDAIWMSDLQCVGNENSLLECRGARLGGENICNHYQDLAIECDPRPRQDTLKVRLVNGPYPNQGIVEVLLNGTWGNVGDKGWHDEAKVVCRQLGFKSAVVALYGDDTKLLYGNSDRDVLLDEVQCEGSEVNIAECFYSVPGRWDYYRNEDAGVVCFSEDYPSIDPRPQNSYDSSVEVRNIIIGVIAGVAFCFFLCLACFKYNKNTEQVVEAVPMQAVSENQPLQDAPPKYEDVKENPGRFPVVAVDSSPPPPPYTSQEPYDSVTVEQTAL